MTDIAAIEARLEAALDRIAKGVEAVPVPDTGAEEEIARLKAALEAEKASNSKLTERVSAISATQEQTVGALEKRVLKLQERVTEQDEEIQRLKRANTALRATSKAIRQAVSESATDAGQINTALEAELESVQAAQAADRAELDAILAELTPLIEEKANV